MMKGDEDQRFSKKKVSPITDPYQHPAYPIFLREHESARKGQRDDRMKPRFFQETEGLFWIYSPVMVESEGLLGSSPKNVQILVVTDTELGMNRRYDNYLRVMELNQGKDPKSSCLEKQ